MIAIFFKRAFQDLHTIIRYRCTRGSLLIGYVIDDERHFQINPLTAPFVLDAFKRYDEGATMTVIRDWLNEQGVTNTLGRSLNYNSVQLMLNNRRYIGEFRYRDVIIPDGIPAIVPPDLFERVQEKMAKNKKAPAHHKAEEDYLLTTKLFCGHCGAYLCGESGTSRTAKVHHYYKCVNAKKRKTCKKKPVQKIWLEDLVINETMKIVMDDKAIEAIVSMVLDLQECESTSLPLYEQQLQEANTGIQNLLNAIYLYDDKIIITFNYKDGTKSITFDEISGSDLYCPGAPNRGNTSKIK